jgi:hypothetical protein
MELEEENDNNKSQANQNQSQPQQKPIIKLDPKALEMLKSYERKIPLKEYNYNEELIHLPERYKPGEIIGCGAYGVILSAVDTQNNNQVVAIKKIEKYFRYN